MACSKNTKAGRMVEDCAECVASGDPDDVAGEVVDKFESTDGAAARWNTDCASCPLMDEPRANATSSWHSHMRSFDSAELAVL